MPGTVRISVAGGVAELLAQPVDVGVQVLGLPPVARPPTAARIIWWVQVLPAWRAR